MSHRVSLPCGCTAFLADTHDVAPRPVRRIEFKGEKCIVRTHERGARVYLWELLPAGPLTKRRIDRALNSSDVFTRRR